MEKSDYCLNRKHVILEAVSTNVNARGDQSGHEPEMSPRYIRQLGDKLKKLVKIRVRYI